MADFDLAKGLMQLSSFSEQRKARKEEKKFREMYEAPLKQALVDMYAVQTKGIGVETKLKKKGFRLRKREFGLQERKFEAEEPSRAAATNLNEAYADYYNAMASKAADPILLDLEKQLKQDQLTKSSFETDRMGMVIDAIEKLDKEDPLRSQVLFGIKGNEEFRDQLAAIRVRNEQLQTTISQMNLQLGISKFKQDQTESLLGLIISPEGRTFLQGVLGEAGLESVKTRTAEEFTGTKAPKAPERKPGGGVGGFLMKRGAEVSNFLTRAKPKPAPKKEEKMEPPSAITTEEVAAIADKAQENDVKWSDVLKGIETLISKFPELSKADVLSAYEQLAAGFTIEELIAYYEELKEE